jgi:CRP/FNR family transcriptional regulator
MHTQTVSSHHGYAPLPSVPPSTGAIDHIDELQAALGPHRWFARGRYLFRTGEHCAGIYLLEEGSVKVSTLSHSGDEQIVRFYLPGELLGLEAFGQSLHNSSAMALEATRVRPLSLPALQALCQRSPDLYRSILQIVSGRIAELQEHMLMLGHKSAAERLASFLTDLTKRTHTHELQLSMSRDAIGSYLGIALETVSRLLHRFQNEKLIRLQGRHVWLVKPDRLRELAEGGHA